MKKRLLWCAFFFLPLSFFVVNARREPKPLLRAGMTYEEVVQNMKKSGWEYKILPKKNYEAVLDRLKSHSINAKSLACVLTANSPESSNLSCISKYDFCYIYFDKNKKVVNFDEDSSCQACVF